MATIDVIVSAVRRQFHVPVSIRRPIMIHGPSGIGKSDGARQACAAEGARMFDRRLALMTPVDVGGLPDMATGGFLRSYVMPPMGCGPALLFLDEIDKAPPLTQSSALGLCLDREVHGHRLSDDVVIVAAANRLGDGAFSQKISTALSSRFVHLDAETDHRQWERDFAIPAGVRIEVIAFLRFHSELFHRFDPAKDRDARSFPCPRTWHMVSDVMEQGHDPATEAELIRGAVGDGPGGEFIAFLRVFARLPSPQGIIMDPDNAAVPQEPSVLFALCGSLSRLATGANFAAVKRYADRLPQEFAAFMVCGAVRRAPEVQQTRAYAEWTAEHSDAFM